MTFPETGNLNRAGEASFDLYGSDAQVLDFFSGVRFYQVGSSGVGKMVGVGGVGLYVMVGRSFSLCCCAEFYGVGQGRILLVRHIRVRVQIMSDMCNAFYFLDD